MLQPQICCGLLIECCFARALCDTRNIGKLTKDQFALAIYLIQQKLKGVDPPAKLPPEMIPPSIRRSSLVVCSVLLLLQLLRCVFLRVLCAVIQPVKQPAAHAHSWPCFLQLFQDQDGPKSERAGFYKTNSVAFVQPSGCRCIVLYIEVNSNKLFQKLQKKTRNRR